MPTTVLIKRNQQQTVKLKAMQRHHPNTQKTQLNQNTSNSNNVLAQSFHKALIVHKKTKDYNLAILLIHIRNKLSQLIKPNKTKAKQSTQNTTKTHIQANNKQATTANPPTKQSQANKPVNHSVQANKQQANTTTYHKNKQNQSNKHNPESINTDTTINQQQNV